MSHVLCIFWQNYKFNEQFSELISINLVIIFSKKSYWCCQFDQIDTKFKINN